MCHFCWTMTTELKPRLKFKLQKRALILIRNHGLICIILHVMCPYLLIDIKFLGNPSVGSHPGTWGLAVWRISCWYLTQFTSVRTRTKIHLSLAWWYESCDFTALYRDSSHWLYRLSQRWAQGIYHWRRASAFARENGTSRPKLLVKILTACMTCTSIVAHYFPLTTVVCHLRQIDIRFSCCLGFPNRQWRSIGRSTTKSIRNIVHRLHVNILLEKSF
jgi:hypothetical protein